jgi:hypothetical protein
VDLVSDEQDKPDNVIAFPSVKEMRESGGPVSRKLIGASGYCLHYSMGVFVDALSRKVVCKKCAVELDPIQALSELAQTWDWEEARRAKRTAEAEATRLLADVARLKSLRSRTARGGVISVSSMSEGLTKIVNVCREHAQGKCTPDEREAYSYVASQVDQLRLKLIGGASEQESLDV